MVFTAHALLINNGAKNIPGTALYEQIRSLLEMRRRKNFNVTTYREDNGRRQARTDLHAEAAAARNCQWEEEEMTKKII